MSPSECCYRTKAIVEALFPGSRSISTVNYIHRFIACRGFDLQQFAQLARTSIGLLKLSTMRLLGVMQNSQGDYKDPEWIKSAAENTPQEICDRDNQ